MPYKITGDTYPTKDKLKRLGCRWSSEDKCWTTEYDYVFRKAMALLESPVQEKKVQPQTEPLIELKPEFREKAQSFFEGCRRIFNDYEDTCGYETKNLPWELKWSERHARIYHGGYIFVLVDIQTGAVLKPSAPKTKINRGNIFDEHNGLKYMGWRGVADADLIRDDKKGRKFISASSGKMPQMPVEVSDYITKCLKEMCRDRPFSGWGWSQMPGPDCASIYFGDYVSFYWSSCPMTIEAVQPLLDQIPKQIAKLEDVRRRNRLARGE
jgi:hypothetical protein